MNLLRVKPAKRPGFTLIELLSAIAILMVIVTIVGMVFTESDRAWTLGTNRSEMNLAGRAALGMLAHDLQYALADRTLSFAVATNSTVLGRTPPTSYGFKNSDLSLVSLSEDVSGVAPADSSKYRAVKEIHYYMLRDPEATNRVSYVLMRGFWDTQMVATATAGVHCYNNVNWYKTGGGNPGLPGNGRFIAKNVSAFSVYVPDNNPASPTRGTLVREYLSTTAANSNRLPEFVDICLELMTDREARQAGRMSMPGSGVPAAELASFINKNVVRYTTRVYLHNRDGYKERIR